MLQQLPTRFSLPCGTLERRFAAPEGYCIAHPVFTLWKTHRIRDFWPLLRYILPIIFWEHKRSIRLRSLVCQTETWRLLPWAVISSCPVYRHWYVLKNKTDTWYSLCNAVILRWPLPALRQPPFQWPHRATACTFYSSFCNASISFCNRQSA